jgi:hypothetical protein
MPRCHIYTPYGARHILHLAPDNISAIQRLAVTTPDNYLHAHSLMVLLTAAWPRLVNVTHLHIDGAGHDQLYGREKPNLTALATILNLQHLELFDIAYHTTRANNRQRDHAYKPFTYRCIRQIYLR